MGRPRASWGVALGCCPCWSSMRPGYPGKALSPKEPLNHRIPGYREALKRASRPLVLTETPATSSPPRRLSASVTQVVQAGSRRNRPVCGAPCCPATWMPCPKHSADPRYILSKNIPQNRVVLVQNISKLNISRRRSCKELSLLPFPYLIFLMMVQPPFCQSYKCRPSWRTCCP